MLHILLLLLSHHHASHIILQLKINPTQQKVLTVTKLMLKVVAAYLVESGSSYFEVGKLLCGNVVYSQVIKCL